MDFDLSEDQRALRDAATELLDDHSSPARVRAANDSETGWDPELWARAVGQGWLGVAVPEADGGLGLTLVEAAVLLEAVGSHVAPIPLLPTLIAIEVARRAGDAVLLASLLDGTHIPCVAWSAAPGAVRATMNGTEGVVLDGRADPAPFASVADLAIVTATDDVGLGVYLVDLAVVGRPPREIAMDLSRPLAWPSFSSAPARRLGGPELAEFVTDLGATGSSLELLGAGTTALDLSVAYAKERVQFGRPIGSFQAVKHRCADMLVDVEGMRSSAYWAAWCLAVDDGDRGVAASTAKTWAGDASKRVMSSALQVHGGIGFTWEHDLHLFLKRAQLDQLQFGDAGFHRSRLAGRLRAKVAAGESVL